ncbi:collagenase [Myxococcus faecalis]|uniref:collagenase n=1 Tax=Myxococcus faecalis TaxID=3115646 RepID=UPI003CECEC5A
MRRPNMDECRRHLFFTLCLALFSLEAAARPGGPAPAEPLFKRHGHEHTHRRIRPDERPPDVAPEYLRRPLAPPAAARPLVACDVAALGTASGDRLVARVKSAEPDCLQMLFDIEGVPARQVFSESKMLTIAHALTADARAYAGNNSARTLQLILFLRAGYYAQDRSPDVVGTFGTALRDALRPALVAFVANSHFQDVNDAHGAVLSEFVTLIDSAKQTTSHLETLQGLLDRFDDTALASESMRGATSNVFFVLYNSHGDDDFVAAVRRDASLLDALDAFVTRNRHLLGTDDEHLTVNAARELARFLQHPGTLQDRTRARVKALLDSHSKTGPTAGVWVSAAELAEHFDGANCAAYGICGFRTALVQDVLGTTYECSPQLRLRVQQMADLELFATCLLLFVENIEFHGKLMPNNVPVAGDNNAVLEMAIFDNSQDYRRFAGPMFGIDTNNGGMYLEGNPSAPGNQARAILHEAEWLRPSFKVWNLEHEYVHYLDGRFDMWGDFGASTSQPTIWWIEGLAEYIDKQQNNPGAVATGNNKTFQLSQILRNSYSDSAERIYTWGYLAVRFMFERHASQVGIFLGQFRAGDYLAYRQSLDTLGTAYDAEFHQWLTCIATAIDPLLCRNPGG